MRVEKTRFDLIYFIFFKAYLASVHSDGENAFLNHLAQPHEIVIGGQLGPGGWTWTDGSPWDYHNWRQCSPLSLVLGQWCFALIGWILITVFLCQHSYAIKTQLKAPKPPY